MRAPVLALLFVFALAACSKGEVSKVPAPRFVWPAPAGWRTETIPFPLDFAPDLPYRGLEEIRFAPDFFDPGTPGYFSYAFVWWLEGRPDLGRKSLERDLARYFAGLCDAVGGRFFTFDPDRFKATLSAGTERAPGERFYLGAIATYDPFQKGNGREIALNVEIVTRDCPTADRRVVLVKASPKPRSDVIWKDLADIEASFRCQ
jgi:hypothetical protein